MIFSPASMPWFAAHEWRLMWRDGIAMMTGGHPTRRIALIVILVIAAASGSTLVTVRSLGPLWCALIVLAVLCREGWPRTGVHLPRGARLAIGLVLLSMAASIWWTLSQRSLTLRMENIDDTSLQSELMGYSAQRRDFANDLQNLVASFGDRPAQSGSVAGAMHRGWINLRDALTTRDAYAILAECERGEDSAVAEYRKAAEAGLPAEFDQVIESQFAAVQATHDRIKSLRDSFKRS